MLKAKMSTADFNNSQRPCSYSAADFRSGLSPSDEKDNQAVPSLGFFIFTLFWGLASKRKLTLGFGTSCRKSCVLFFFFFFPAKLFTSYAYARKLEVLPALDRRYLRRATRNSPPAVSWRVDFNCAATAARNSNRWRSSCWKKKAFEQTTPRKLVLPLVVGAPPASLTPCSVTLQGAVCEKVRKKGVLVNSCLKLVSRETNLPCTCCYRPCYVRPTRNPHI